MGLSLTGSRRAFGLGARRRAALWWLPSCLALLSCSVHDDGKLQPGARPDDAGPRQDAGRGDGGAAPDGGGPSRPSDGGGTPPPDASSDAGPTGQPSCIPNPGDPDCPERCAEICNGTDDDCDGTTDEAEANLTCNFEHTTSLCNRGACLVIECLDDYRDCDGDAGNGCEIAPDDPNNCGRCGMVCDLPGALATCENGECAATGCDAEGLGDCDGDRLDCETRLASLEHCGACGVPCGGLAQASPQCESGSCAVKECLGNFGDCDSRGDNGCETPLDSLVHCGGCNAPCAKASCSGGVCTAVVCPAPTADCNRDEVDCEVDLSSNVQHCGGCGRPCAFRAATPRATLSCAASRCGAQCDTGFGDCDEDYASGCETALTSTATHCGACGRNCSSVLAHVAQSSCANSTCGVVSCQSGWGDCDKVASNGCERNTAVEGPCLPDASCTAAMNGTHEYFFCTAALSWAAARTRCQQQARGDLVAIGSMAENDFVSMRAPANAWIGARDVGVEGTWRWESDGVPFWRGNANGAAVMSRFARWSSGQPDDAGANEHCAEIWAGGLWNDNVCAGTHPFVCERQPDECTSDANKIAPGQCGCGAAETDDDADGFANCAETCDADPAKQAQGTCGCGQPDTDSDGDGLANCMDGCPTDPGQTSECLAFAPTNFDPRPINWSAQPITALDCQATTTIDTRDPDGTGPLVATISNWCGTAPTPVAQAQTNGPEAVIIPLRGLTLGSTRTLRLIGTRPVILAVDGDATISGTIDASASSTTPGAGGNWSCGTAAGGNGTGSNSSGAGGGGGGGFGTAGGRGGSGGNGSPGVAGVARGDGNLAPLIGGCNGGIGGGCSATGGAGGGAFQITVSGTLTVTGTLRSNGGNGGGGCGSEGGGIGGGSGGGIVLEATTLTTGSATLQANGGNGGQGAGGPGGGSGSTSPSNNGSNGNNEGANGGSGAGGGYGRIRSIDR